MSLEENSVTGTQMLESEMVRGEEIASPQKPMSNNLNRSYQEAIAKFDVGKHISPDRHQNLPSYPTKASTSSFVREVRKQNIHQMVDRILEPLDVTKEDVKRSLNHFDVKDSPSRRGFENYETFGDNMLAPQSSQLRNALRKNGQNASSQSIIYSEFRRGSEMDTSQNCTPSRIMLSDSHYLQPQTSPLQTLQMRMKLSTGSKANLHETSVNSRLNEINKMILEPLPKLERLKEFITPSKDTLEGVSRSTYFGYTPNTNLNSNNNIQMTTQDRGIDERRDYLVFNNRRTQHGIAPKDRVLDARHIKLTAHPNLNERDFDYKKIEKEVDVNESMLELSRNLLKMAKDGMRDLRRVRCAYRGSPIKRGMTKNELAETVVTAKKKQLSSQGVDLDDPKWSEKSNFRMFDSTATPGYNDSSIKNKENNFSFKKEEEYPAAKKLDFSLEKNVQEADVESKNEFSKIEEVSERSLEKSGGIIDLPDKASFLLREDDTKIEEELKPVKKEYEWEKEWKQRNEEQEMEKRFKEEQEQKRLRDLEMEREYYQKYEGKLDSEKDESVMAENSPSKFENFSRKSEYSQSNPGKKITTYSYQSKYSTSQGPNLKGQADQTAKVSSQQKISIIEASGSEKATPRLEGNTQTESSMRYSNSKYLTADNTQKPPLSTSAAQKKEITVKAESSRVGLESKHKSPGIKSTGSWNKTGSERSKYPWESKTFGARSQAGDEVTEKIVGASPSKFSNLGSRYGGASNIGSEANIMRSGSKYSGGNLQSKSSSNGTSRSSGGNSIQSDLSNSDNGLRAKLGAKTNIKKVADQVLADVLGDFKILTE